MTGATDGKGNHLDILDPNQQPEAKRLGLICDSILRKEPQKEILKECNCMPGLTCEHCLIPDKTALNETNLPWVFP